MKYVLRTIDFTVQYANGLVKDVPEERMAEQPHGVPNHPAWVIGHLAATNDFFLKVALGQPTTLPESWGKLFGPGSSPTTDRAIYPAKAELLDALVKTCERLSAALQTVSEEELNQPNPVEKMASRFPTKGDVLAFIATSHAAMHLGQVSSWRRAAGLGSVF